MLRLSPGICEDSWTVILVSVWVAGFFIQSKDMHVRFTANSALCVRVNVSVGDCLSLSLRAELEKQQQEERQDRPWRWAECLWLPSCWLVFVCFLGLHCRYWGIQDCEKWAIWQSKESKLKDATKKCREPYLERSALFFHHYNSNMDKDNKT